VPTKQTGKKQSKGTVNLSDGFAKVAYERVGIHSSFAPPEHFDNSSTSNRAFKNSCRKPIAWALLLGVTS
jgi:hypothetical protein